MDRAQFDQLNEIYTPLAGRAEALTRRLKAAGYSVCMGWYANHSVKLEGKYETEVFPIPVVAVDGLGDIGFDLDGVFLELQLPREKALDFDYGQLPEGAEVYGAEDYLGNFYRPGMDPEEVLRRIRESREETVCIAMSFPGHTEAGTLYDAVQMWCGRLKG